MWRVFHLDIKQQSQVRSLTWPDQLFDQVGRLVLPEHAHCTLGGVKVNRAHFVGGGRHNLLQHLWCTLKKNYLFVQPCVRYILRRNSKRASLRNPQGTWHIHKNGLQQVSDLHWSRTWMGSLVDHKGLRPMAEPLHCTLKRGKVVWEPHCRLTDI